MRDKMPKLISVPSEEAVIAERERLRGRRDYRRFWKGILCALVVTAAAVVLAVTFVFPILQVTGNSMEPSFRAGNLILMVKSSDCERGDVCGFYYGNKLLLKRVIGMPGDVISVDSAGNVEVNGETIQEPYVSELSQGECDIAFPCRVAEDCYFVMGDNRKVSVDSRSSLIGCVNREQIVGKAVLRLWPLGGIS